MISLLLLLIPLAAGLLTMFTRSDRDAKSLSLFASVLTLIVSFASLAGMFDKAQLNCNVAWLPFWVQTLALPSTG